MPGTRCAMYGCNNNYFDEKASSQRCSFHRFPKGKDLVSRTIRNEWIVRCRREDKVNPYTSYVCSVHFTENDYERDLQNELLGLPLKKILKRTAVPTLFLFNQKPPTEAGLCRSKRPNSKNAKKEAQQVLSELLAATSNATSEIREKNPSPEPMPGPNSEPRLINCKAKS